MKWTVFDLEFTKLLNNDQWDYDLHVSCASIFSTDDHAPQVWHELDGPHMSTLTLEAFVDALEVRTLAGHTLVTWGGSASDWRVLFVECPSRRDKIKAMALESIDVPMCSCMSIGMMMGLNAACMALGFTLKDAHASSSAPDMWTNGQREKVLQHVSNDSYATMYVLTKAIEARSLVWITQRGQMRTWDIHLRSVRECLQCELPRVPFAIGPTMNAKLLARWLILE